jgi:uncharacterized membrane protein AbrB (regulator of aidB expression)
MSGFSVRYFKICVVLLAITIGMALSWSYLPRFLFAVIIILIFSSVLMALIKRIEPMDIMTSPVFSVPVIDD